MCIPLSSDSVSYTHLVSREISKIHEETIRGTLTELVEHFTANEPRGEIVIVVAGIDD